MNRLWPALALTGLVVLACSDSAGNITSPDQPSAQNTGAALVNLRPVAVPGGPYTGTVGQQVTFDGSASFDPDGPDEDMDYAWFFGDGGQEWPDPVEVHTYGEPGVYTVTLQLRDGLGKWGHQVSTTATITDEQGNGADPVFIGAGDIVKCGGSGAFKTSAILDTIQGTVFTLGDNVYEEGTLQQYQDCYGASWGQHKARTRPTPGNHEYLTPDALGYFLYFGAYAGPWLKGYYSYDLGTWHVVSLNSNIDMTAGSEQEQWLRNDLANTTAQCVLAYWHHPRFNSASNDNYLRSQDIWQALYDAGADVVLNGHAHVYERFAPQDPDGNLDAAAGIRQFTIGTGGKGNGPWGTVKPNSEVRYRDSFGVVKFVLKNGSYTWEFVAPDGLPSPDTGSDTCN